MMVAEEAELRRSAAELEHLLDELRAMVAPPAWQRIERVVHDIAALYAGGLERALGHARALAPVPRVFDDRVCDDELLASLLVIHGLHPHSTQDRIRRALARLGHGELAEFRDDGSVVVRAPADAEARIRRAIEEAAPEVQRIDIAGSPALVQIRRTR
jgi:hypothetical protein